MISAIIPAANEAKGIGETLRALAEARCVDEVIVVDDGSKDGTGDIARQAGARVLRLPANQGKTAALAAGVASSLGRILVFLDADLGETAGQARDLLLPIVTDTADMAIATFPVKPGVGGGIGLVVKLARWGIRRATGMEVASPLSGQRALRRSVWEFAGGRTKGFGVEVALTIDAFRAEYRIIEVPTTMTHRVTPRSLAGFLHRGRQFVSVVRVLWSRRGVRPAP